MADLVTILVGGLLMAVIAMVGGLTVFLSAATLDRWLLPLVAFAAGSLIGGAFFHMLPAAQSQLTPFAVAAWLTAGFTGFLAIEQFLHWHHAHRAAISARKPVTYLILLGDAMHNLIGGLGVASTFLIDPRAGLVAWLAAVAHEVPQELGDFGVLVQGGWPRRRALVWNLISALTFPIGGVAAYFVSQSIDVAALVAFGAGNFIYIAASDLIPEIKAQGRVRAAAVHFGCFLSGILLVVAVSILA